MGLPGEAYSRPGLPCFSQHNNRLLLCRISLQEYESKNKTLLNCRLMCECSRESMGIHSELLSIRNGGGLDGLIGRNMS